MHLEHLRFFHAVAETGSFTRAAEELLLTQPAVSSQIIKLEDEIGQKLFERRGKQVQLTRAGRSCTPSRARSSSSSVRRKLC